MKYEPVFGDQSLFDGAPEDAEMAASVCQMPRWYTMFNGKVLFCDSKKESWQSADFNHPGSQLLAMRRIEEGPDSQLVTDGMPSFYVGSSGACTHKMAESDIPVWCNDVDDTCTAMGFINDCLRLTRKPKRWTIADQKAGRLPVSGCKAIYIPESFAMCSCDVIHVDGNKACIKCENNHSMHSDWFGVVDVSTLIPIETPEEKAVRLRHEWNEKAHELYWNESKNSFYDLYDAMLSGVLETPQAM